MSKTRNLWKSGESATFTYSFPTDPQSDISNRLAHRTGQTVTVLGTEDSDGRDLMAELPTLAERMDAASPLVYSVRFPDGHTDTVFEDELTEVES